MVKYFHLFKILVSRVRVDSHIVSNVLESKQQQRKFPELVGSGWDTRRLSHTEEWPASGHY